MVALILADQVQRALTKVCAEPFLSNLIGSSVSRLTGRFTLFLCVVAPCDFHPVARFEIGVKSAFAGDAASEAEAAARVPVAERAQALPALALT